MKIVCDACSAKYSISDDKVQGKVFKIRCKKCSNIIVVRGNAGAAAAAEPSSPQEKDTRVFDYGYDENSGAAPAASDAVWHVVIDQDQVGPLSVADVQKRFSSGEIDADTYIWREGFADWLPISQVDAFASLFSGGGAAAASDDGLFGGASSGGGSAAVSDLFGGGGLDTSISGGDDDGDVFASRRSSSGPAASPQAQAQADSKLRGERGENSVLFSLSNLAQLASDSPRPQQSSSSSSSSAGSAQHGGGEGSGLIDIRSMASAYLAPDKASAKSASPSLGSAADLPVFSSTGFGEPAVIVPMVRSSANNNNKLIFGLVGLVGVLAIVAVIMVVVLLKDKPAAKPETVAVATETDKPGGADPAAGSAGSAAAGAAGTPAGGTDPAGTPAGSAAGTPAGGTDSAGSSDSAGNSGSTASTPSGNSGSSGSSGSSSSSGSKRPDKSGGKSSGGSSSSGGKSSGSAKAPEEPKPEPKPAKGGGNSDCDAVACLVDPSQPCCKKSGGSKTGGGSSGGGAKVDSSLPEQLDSSMIKAGIDKVKGKAQACGSKSSAKGAVKVRIKATPDGKVGSVDVVSAPDDALGNCVASALRGASFAKTQRGMGFAYTLSF